MGNKENVGAKRFHLLSIESTFLDFNVGLLTSFVRRIQNEFWYTIKCSRSFHSSRSNVWKCTFSNAAENFSYAGWTLSVFRSNLMAKDARETSKKTIFYYHSCCIIFMRFNNFKFQSSSEFFSTRSSSFFCWLFWKFKQWCNARCFGLSFIIFFHMTQPRFQSISKQQITVKMVIKIVYFTDIEWLLQRPREIVNAF
jgi:hypothetical protein